MAARVFSGAADESPLWAMEDIVISFLLFSLRATASLSSFFVSLRSNQRSNEGFNVISQKKNQPQLPG
jgi:hypothetical protein